MRPNGARGDMTMNLIQTIEQEEVARLTAGKTIPEFQPGDTVVVNVKVPQKLNRKARKLLEELESELKEG